MAINYDMAIYSQALGMGYVTEVGGISLGCREDMVLELGL